MTIENRLRGAWRWSFDAGRTLANEWTKDRIGGLAAEIAFFALLGFFPMVIVMAAALGWADTIVGENAAAEAEDWLVDRMIEVFGGENTLEATVNDLFEGSSTQVFTIGAVLGVYAASRGFTAVVRALDVVYDHERARRWLSTRLMGLALTVLTAVVAAVVLMLIVVGPLFGSGEEWADDLGVGSWLATLWDWFRWPVVFGVLVAWAATVYHVAPNHRSPWRYELPGALLASVWWSLVSLGFRSYLDAASSGGNAIYGLLGGALSLLFWLYLMAMGLLLGAEINSLVAVARGVDLDEPRTRRTLPLGNRRRVRSEA